MITKRQVLRGERRLVPTVRRHSEFNTLIGAIGMLSLTMQPIVRNRSLTPTETAERDQRRAAKKAERKRRKNGGGR